VLLVLAQNTHVAQTDNMSAGEQSNPNDGPNTQIKYRKYRRLVTGGRQIKSNQMEPPRKKSKSNPTQTPAQKTQMGPNGGARRAPPFGGLTVLALTKIDALAQVDHRRHTANPNP
jgi:hypothetical protein